jgi:formylglycine-generating enzyme required for sulfatase activity
MFKTRKKMYIGITLLIISITLSGCGTAPEGVSATIDMILIPAGEFEMGQDADLGLSICQELYEPYGDNDCNINTYEDEEPVHIVWLDDYYIDKYEITTADYQVCVEAEVCYLPKKTRSKYREDYYGNPEFANYPVIFVSWFDAQTYCDWRGARLPTEAEWEKAARGTDGRIYPWGNSFDGELGNFYDRGYEYDDGYTDTAPVGTYPEGASPYDVMDLAGNVWEWVADWYGYRYFSSSPKENPQGPATGSERVLKGGSWYKEGNYDVSTSDRMGWFPDYKYDYIGFRCSSSSP